jgi:hypothetical protein
MFSFLSVFRPEEERLVGRFVDSKLLFGDRCSDMFVNKEVNPTNEERHIRREY